MYQNVSKNSTQRPLQTTLETIGATMSYLDPNWGPFWEVWGSFGGPLGTKGSPLGTKVEPKGAKMGAKGTNREVQTSNTYYS